MSHLGTDPRSLPMFPLGSPLLPSMLLPLRIFEPRYRTLVHDVLEGDGTFGVVMIERGSEVGGGDVRAEVGCLARVVRADPAGDGQWMLICVGAERFRILEWEAEEPYPRATVAGWDDEPPEAEPSLEDVLARFHAVMARLRELGPGTAQQPEEGLVLAEDATTAVYQMAVVSPLGSLDRYRLLSAPGLADRVHLLAELLADAELLLAAQQGEDGTS